MVFLLFDDDFSDGVATVGSYGDDVGCWGQMGEVDGGAVGCWGSGFEGATLHVEDRP